MTVTKDGKTIKERIAIYGVAGLSFPVQRLEVDRRARLSKTVIEIEDANDGLLIPKKDSGVPINMGFGQNKEFGASFFTHAINVTWQFVKSGIRFVSEDGLYEVEKVGATISFTLDGVKLDGIKIASKK